MIGYYCRLAGRDDAGVRRWSLGSFVVAAWMSYFWRWLTRDTSLLGVAFGLLLDVSNMGIRRYALLLAAGLVWLERPLTSRLTTLLGVIVAAPYL